VGRLGLNPNGSLRLSVLHLGGPKSAPVLARQPCVVLGVVGWAYRLHSLVAAPEEAAPSAFRLCSLERERVTVFRLCQRAFRAEGHQQAVPSAARLESARLDASALALRPVAHFEVRPHVALAPQTSRSISPDDAELALVRPALGLLWLRLLWPLQPAVPVQARPVQARPVQARPLTQ
jgi:hypothetical protein